MIRVDSWGIASSVVDAGAPGRAWIGAARGGAVDLDGFALANRLVGNPARARAFETSGGLTVSVTAATMVAVGGGVTQAVVEGGPPLGWGAPVVLPAGATVRFGRMVEGARAYVAVRGGLIGSGDELGVGPDPLDPAAAQPVGRREPRTTVRVWPGPRADWFTAEAHALLVSAAFTVTTTSRVGTRLDGPGLERAHPGELPSEGLVEGAVQVPPDGRPIVMLADHPTTGGYPVIAVVDPADLSHVAQAAPGTALHFTSPGFRSL